MSKLLEGVRHKIIDGAIHAISHDLNKQDKYVPDESNTYDVTLIPFDDIFIVAWLNKKRFPKSQQWRTDDRLGCICFYGLKMPDLHDAATANGMADMGDGKYQGTWGDAKKVIRELGGELDFGDIPDDRVATLRMEKSKANRLVVEIQRADLDEFPLPVVSKSKFQTVVKINCDDRPTIPLQDFDDLVRALVTPGGEHAGWAVKKSNKDSWDIQPTHNIKLMLLGHPFSVPRSDVEAILGTILNNRWDLVSLPFQPEFPGNRQWNYKATQWRFKPVDHTQHHPMWDMMLSHIGGDLDAHLPGDMTGREYLIRWVAALMREPLEPLPYLFLFGPENSGKSILHEAIGKLMTAGGVTYADKALTTTGEFNGELQGAVLAVVEEVDANGIGGARARARMKQWTVGETLQIRRMRTDPYHIPNHLHWIQCSNKAGACLAALGDTRITAIHVPPFEGREIPKSVLKRQLENEAPHFMRTLVDVELPKAQGRLRIPIIETESKRRIMANNDPLGDLKTLLAELMPHEGDQWRGTIAELRDLLNDDTFGSRKIGVILKQPEIIRAGYVTADLPRTAGRREIMIRNAGVGVTV